MEAASAILYSENSVVGDRNERWRNVVIHEVAHQWFGNAVTESDWDDVWLSEGFATYFTLLYIEHAYGRDAFLDGLAKSKQRVDAFTVKNPQYRIVHDNLQDMGQVTSSQTYQKGSWILHMLRGVMGTEVFWQGIRSYYETYQNKNATTTDFRNVMEEISGMDLKLFFEKWLYQPGSLKIEGSWYYDKKKKEVTITLNQTQNAESIISMPLEIGIYFPKQPILIKKVMLSKQSNVYTFTIDDEPEQISLDPNTWLLMDASFSKK
jgi:aminopeptidase N